MKQIIKLTETVLHNIIKGILLKLFNRVPFENYDEFKEYANSLPKINEEIDYLDNHPNKEVALAMEVIIQIGNVWEDGIRELTPSMKKYLITAIHILNQTHEKNNQINALIKNGYFYLTHMEVLECHEYVDYIFMPAL